MGYDSEVLKFIRGIRDEVHRFGIGFHRSQRSKGTFVNDLENIAGIGPKTANELLTHFRSVKNIKQANLTALAEVVGMSKAKLVEAHYKQ